MGMIVYVSRSAEFGDCSLNGISASHNRLCVVNVDGPFEPSDDCPAVVLKPSNLGARRALPKLVPEEDQDNWTMDGGNYAGTSDSRFCEAVERICGIRADIVPIHDRIE
jgi:hypothetical protein